ncbi:MAG: preprotein translocase subunit YajC [Bacteroidota bacterium]
MISFTYFLLQDQAAPEGPFGEYTSSILLLGMAVVFFFFFIRPQQQRSKKEKQFREGLKKGDKVKTIGGMHGKIYKVGEATIIMDVADGVRMTFDKEAVRAADNADAKNSKKDNSKKDNSKKEKEAEVASNKDTVEK